MHKHKMKSYVFSIRDDSDRLSIRKRLSIWRIKKNIPVKITNSAIYLPSVHKKPEAVLIEELLEAGEITKNQFKECKGYFTEILKQEYNIHIQLI